MSEDLRWTQRLQNFSKALALLNSAFKDRDMDSYSDLELEGIIQRFEYTFELAWKTLKDYLENEGVLLPQTTPRAVIREAVAQKVISLEEGNAWMGMLKHRNLMSHTYDFELFKSVVITIQKEYLKVLRCFQLEILDQIQ